MVRMVSIASLESTCCTAAPHRHLSSFRRLPGAHVELHEAKIVVLKVRTINRQPGLGAHIAMPGVAHHTDDLDIELDIRAAASRHQLPNRILGIAEELAR